MVNKIAIGSRSALGIAKETTPGTIPAANTFVWFPVDEFSINPEVNKASLDSAVGRTEDSRGYRTTSTISNPTFSGELYDKLFGHLLLAAYGQVSTTADDPETGVNTHDFSNDNINTPVSFSIAFFDPEVDPTNSKVVARARLDNCPININTDDFINYTATFKGNFPTEVSGLVPAYIEETNFTAEDVTLRFSDTIANMGAGTDRKFTAMQLTLTRGANAEVCNGDTNPAEIYTGRFGSEITLDKSWVDDTFYDEFVGDTENAMRLTIANTNVTIGTSTNPTLQVDFNKILVTQWSESRPLNDKITEAITIKPAYKLSEGAMTTAKLINTQTAY